MDLNEIKLKINGTVNINKPLKLGKDYDLTVSNAEVRSVGERLPNDDGTYNEIYKIRLSELSEVNIISEHEIIRGKKRRGSMAQKLRYEIQKRWDDLGLECDFEDYYNKEMSEIINNYNNN